MRFVPSDELELGTEVGRDIIFTAQKAAMLKKGTVLNERYIDYLRQKGYLGAYVNDSLSKDIKISETVDQYIFQEGVNAVMEEDIDEVLDVSGDIVNDILSKPEICTDLLDLRSFDNYTYHHCVNVAVLSVVVGKKMGLDEENLNYLCQAGILHDIGKCRIPESVLNKPDKLSDDEFTLMKNHAQYSYDIIAGSNNISSVVKQAVLCHHENENGSGYPLGKEGSEVSIQAKIIHAVDVYDALTSKRPYKDPYEPATAFKYMEDGKNRQFNSEVVDTLIASIPPYPTGVDVYLSNGERALVIDHSQNRVRPIIRIVSTGDMVDLNSDIGYSNINIARSGIIPIGMDEGNVHDLNESRSAVKLVRKRIFVIDPNKASRMQVESILEHDAHLNLFESGFEGIKHLQTGQVPDLVIIDANMPIMDGIVTVNKMRNELGKMFPVIFLTADNTALSIMRAKELGNTDYILKPANPVYIKERVYHALYNVEA